MTREPPTLSEQQRTFVERCASTLPFAIRENFVADVMKCLVGSPSNPAVKQVVNICLDALPAFTCNDTKGV
jgi:hypothetical protein